MNRKHAKWLFSTVANLKMMFAVRSFRPAAFVSEDFFFDAATFQGVLFSGVESPPPPPSIRDGVINV